MDIDEELRQFEARVAAGFHRVDRRIIGAMAGLKQVTDNVKQAEQKLAALEQKLVQKTNQLAQAGAALEAQLKRVVGVMPGQRASARPKPPEPKTPAASDVEEEDEKEELKSASSPRPGAPRVEPGESDYDFDEMEH